MKKLILLACVFFWVNMVFSQAENQPREQMNMMRNGEPTEADIVSTGLNKGSDIPPPSYRQASFSGGRSGFGYAWNAFVNGSNIPAGPVRINLTTGALMSLKEVPNTVIWMSGAEIVEERWYGVQGGVNNGGLYIIDTSTGDYQLVGPTGQALTGLAYDTYSGTLYASGVFNNASRLYRVNILTGQATFIGQIYPNVSVFGIAADNTGKIYGITSAGELISINPANGQPTLIGQLGITINNAQDIAFNRDANVLYGTLYSESVGGLYSIDVTTGEATLIHNFLAEVTGFAIPYSLAPDLAPDALSSFNATPGPLGALHANLSWVNPSVTYDGSSLTQIDSVIILRNTQLNTVVKNTSPGQSNTYQDAAYTAAGVYTYRGFAVNQHGEGVKTNFSLFVGEDVPAAPGNLILNPEGDFGLLTWEAPTVGLNGGYIGTDITYNIVRFPGQITVATNFAGTEYVDTSVPGIGNYWYRVTARNSKGNGGFATSTLSLLAGGNYLMFEGFNYTSGQEPPEWQRIGAPHVWRLFTGNDAGGITPQLGVTWSPPAAGVSRYMSYPVKTKGNSAVRIRFKNYLHNSLAGNDDGEKIGFDVTWDNGQTFVPLWDTLIGGSHIPASTREFFVNVPEGQNSFRIAYRFEGNSQFINWWSIDDITIEPWFENDMRAVSVAGNNTPSVNTQSIYQVTVQNWGSGATSNYTVKLFKNETILLGMLAGATLQPGQTAVFPFPWTPTANDIGLTNLRAEVEMEGDQNNLNNQTPEFKTWVQPQSIVPVAIGNGTSLQGLPVAMQWHHSLAQTLYFPSEVGMPGGAISGIKYFNNFDIAMPGVTIKLYLGETTATDLRAGWVDPTSLQLVFDGTVDFPAGNNDIFIQFTTPYQYQGGNLVVYAYKQNLDWSNNRNFYSTEAPSSARTRRAARYTTPYNPLAPEQPGLIMNFLPNTVFFIDGSGTGAVQGNITHNNNPLSDVRVKVLGTNLEKFSGQNGQYTVPYIYPGTYSMEFSKFSFYDKVVENVNVSVGQTTNLNIVLNALPLVTVSGFISGSDFPEIGLDSVQVTLTGYNGYEVYTTPDGNFSIDGVYSEKTYGIRVFHPRFLAYEANVTVGTANIDLGNIVLQENPLPVREVVAVETETGAHISWLEPQLFPVREFRYDDGVAEGMLGYTNGNLNSVMGSAYHNIAELYEVSWKLVNPNFQHATVRIRVLGLTAAGLPDRTNVIYDASNIPNTHFEWTTHVFPDTLYAPNGFFIGLSAGNNLGLGMDDGQGPLYPFVPMRHFGISNITSSTANFTPVETWNHLRNFLLRAKGKDLGAIDFGIKEFASSMMDDETPEMDYVVSNTQNLFDLDTASRNEKALESFSIFRFLIEDYHNPEEWTEIATNITEWEFVDTSWPELPEGAYLFAVVAHYSNGVNAPAAFSNMLPKDMFVTYTVNVTTNSGDSPEGAILTLVNQSGNEDHIYTALAQADGQAVFTGVWRGIYTLTIEFPGFEVFLEEELAVIEHGLSFDAELIEIIKTPFGLIVETHNQTPGDARLSWRMDYEFFEGFESQFPPFGWKKLNPDGGTGWMQLGANTTPLPGWTGGVAFPAPNGGNYMAYVTYVHGGANHNDQWLITPELVSVEGFNLSFYIRKHPLHYVDNVDIRISTTVQDDPAAFNILLQALTFPQGTPDDWVLYNYDLSQFVEPGTRFYIAFREHVANNQTQGSGILLDNVHYGPAGRNIAPIGDKAIQSYELIERDLSGNYFYGPAPKKQKAFLGYNVYLNDLENPVAESVMQLEYLFTGLEEGNYTAGVKSVFTTGSSDVVTKNFSIVFPPPVYQLTFVVKDQDGETIENAEINLAGVQYAPGTYVFDDLVAGSYPYIVSLTGYHNTSGTAEIVDNDVTVEVVLNLIIPETYTLTFVIRDQLTNDITDAAITVNGNQNAPGNYIFTDLLPGIYEFTATREGYFPVSGQVQITDTDLTYVVVMTETPVLYQLILNIDMTPATGFDPQSHEVFVSGSFGGELNWVVPGTNPALKLTRDGQSMIYSITLELQAGNYHYKYASNAFGQGWDGAEWVGDPNREVTLENDLSVNDTWALHVGVNEHPELNIKVYPNPASRMVSILSDIEIMKIVLIDISGREIYMADVHDSRYQFDVSNYKNGIYFLKVFTRNGARVTRMQIIR